MSAVARWVVVDSDTRTIVGGPYLWDGTTEWTPPEQGRLILEADAFDAGYTYPTT
jgi:hypothetical protein